MQFCVMLEKNISSHLSFLYRVHVHNVCPWEDITIKKVSKLRYIAELMAFDGTNITVADQKSKELHALINNNFAQLYFLAHIGYPIRLRKN